MFQACKRAPNMIFKELLDVGTERTSILLGQLFKLSLQGGSDP